MKRQTPVIGNCCGFITLLSPSQVGDSEGWMPCPMSSIRAPQKPTHVEPTSAYCSSHPWAPTPQSSRCDPALVQQAHGGTLPATTLTWTSLWTRDMSTFVLSSRFPWKEGGCKVKPLF